MTKETFFHDLFELSYQAMVLSREDPRFIPAFDSLYMTYKSLIESVK